MPASIQVSNLIKSFAEKQGAKRVLDGINLSVAPGEFTALVGASGCGKSTLLRLIAGLDRFDSGSILVGDRQVTRPGADRTMVFQDYSLYPWLTVMENVRFCRELLSHRNDTESQSLSAIDRSYALLELMGLSHAANGSVAKIVKLEHAWRRMAAFISRNIDGIYFGCFMPHGTPIPAAMRYLKGVIWGLLDYAGDPSAKSPSTSKSGR